MEINDGGILFSSGYWADASETCIGLCEDLLITTGSDGSIPLPEDNGITPDDCVELADLMIKRWSALKDKYKQGGKNVESQVD